MLQLGMLKQVDLRDVWENEARDFTPWLAKEANLALLGDVIGIELELEAQEQSVGSFSADLLCKDTVNDNWVVIENQLEKTNHTHLGQLLTYASGLKAVTVVWVAKKFTDEHRATLDWLNEITSEKYNFFGLEVELWRIGDSDVAPKFNIASKPNDWSKKLVSRTAQKVANETLTDTKTLQLAFWEGFSEYVANQGSFIRATKPLPQHWMNIALGKSGTKLSAIVTVYDSESNSYDAQEIRAEVVLYDQDSKNYFQGLYQQKEQIEQEVGAGLKWHNPENTRLCRIYLRKTVNLSDRAAWNEKHDWILTKLEKLHQVFSPRIKAMKFTELTHSIEE